MGSSARPYLLVYAYLLGGFTAFDRPKVLTQMAQTRMRGKIRQLDAIPGFGVITAQDIIAEIGTDMTVFPTAGHLVSWARQAPQVSESAGKRKGKNATGRGNPYIGGALGEASVNAGRTQTFLGAKYRRLVRQMPKKKAQGAISRTQLVIISTPCCPTPKPSTPTSAPTTTNGARTSAARSATTSAPSNATATQSPSKPPARTQTPKPCRSPKPANPHTPGSRSRFALSIGCWCLLDDRQVSVRI